MHPVIPAGALIGRDSELALLTGLVQQAARGRGSSVLIEGEPGIGKSALMRAVAAAAPQVGCQVFWSAGDEKMRVSSAMTVQQTNAAPRGGAGNRLLLPVPGLDVAVTWQVGPVLFHPAGAARELIDAMPREHRRPDHPAFQTWLDSRVSALSDNALICMPQIGHVFLVFTMRAQGPFRHGSRIGPGSWRAQPASAGSS